MLTVDQLEQEEGEHKFLIIPATLAHWLLNARVNYAIVLATVCWFAFALAVCSMWALGFIDGR